MAGQPSLPLREKYFPKRRLRSKDKELVKQILATNDNNHCYICGEDAPLEHLELDHLNGDISDNRLENIRLAHHSCNAKAYWHRIRGPSLALSYQDERENKSTEAEGGKDATQIIHEVVDYSKGSPEMQANEFAEIDYRSWLTAYVKLNRRILLSEAIGAGAEKVGVSPSTTYRYLLKLVSMEGELRKYKDKDQKRWFVTAKEDVWLKWKEDITSADMELLNRTV
jgi:hypothetical protein